MALPQDISPVNSELMDSLAKTAETKVRTPNDKGQKEKKGQDTQN